MKRIVAIIISGAFIQMSFSQKSEPFDDKGSRLLGLHVGLSMTGLLYEADNHGDTIDYISNARPAIEGSFDYFTRNRVSLGLQASVQHFDVSIARWMFFDAMGNMKVVENQTAKMNRIYFGAKVLLHYKNTPKLDLYSGFRLGIVKWTNKMSVDDARFTREFENEFPQYNRPALGIIAFGGRFKFTPKIGANFELNLGAPHLFAFGLTYRLEPAK